MIKAQVLTGWVDAGEDVEVPGMTPEVALDYALEVYGDMTLQKYVSDPNLFVVEIICDEAVYDAIDVDPKYIVLASEVDDG